MHTPAQEIVPGGGLWIRSLWTFKEGASSVGPHDTSGRWSQLQIQSTGFKNRINGRPRMGKTRHLRFRPLREGETEAPCPTLAVLRLIGVSQSKQHRSKAPLAYSGRH